MRSQPKNSRLSALYPAIGGVCLIALGVVLISGWAATPTRSAAAAVQATTGKTIAAPRITWTPSSAVTAASTAAAIENTSTAVNPASLIYNKRATVLFPALVRFNMTIQVPVGDVKSAQMTITQGTFSDKTDVQLFVRKSLLIVSDQSAGIDYEWPLAGHEALKLFQSVNYAWQITLKSGQVIPVTGTFQYEDTANPLTPQTTDRLTLYAPLSLQLNVILPTVTAAQSLIVRDSGIDQHASYAIYPLGTPICSPDPKNAGQFFIRDATDNAEFPCDPAEAAKLYLANGVTLLRLNTLSISTITNGLITTLADNAYNTLWNASSPAPASTNTPIATSRSAASILLTAAATSAATAASTNTPPQSDRLPPGWFRRGLALFYTPGARTDLLAFARQAAQTDTLFTLDQLAVIPDTPGAQTDAGTFLRDSQSYLLTLYLVDKFGADAPVKLAQQFAVNHNFIDALNSVTDGTSLADVYAGWQDWLFSAKADAILSFSPYPTITPSASALPSPTTLPTFTPGTFVASPVPSATATPSASPTGSPAVPVTPSVTSNAISGVLSGS